jgi:arylsulfatase A-like enzyme
MRGQYPHNTKVWINDGHNGGWQAYKDNGNEADNVATRLNTAGYRTGLFGKYLNHYKNTRYIPPGWDEWFAPWGNNYFNYDANDNGTLKHFGTSTSDYKTDVQTRRTLAFIGTSATQGKPFFAYVAPSAPHQPATPAPRDKHTYDNLTAPRPPSFNERDVSDKPPWIRQLPRLSDSRKAQIDNVHEKRAESLQAVDDLVAGVVDKLRDKGVLSNTYIFFTSDNGYHEGEHRIPAKKWRPYEEDIHMPLLVRGPGVRAGSTTHKLTLNTDYLPTFTDLAGTQTPPYVDGSSLKPVLNGSVTSWRSAILLEAAAEYTPAYRGIRTIGSANQKYVEYEGGARELYYLGRDPYELNNRYPATKPSAGLVSRLQALKSCRANPAPPEVTCQVAED